MKTPIVDTALRERIIQDVQSGPCVSIMLPFEPKMSTKAQLQERLKRARNEVEEQLTNNYPRNISERMMQDVETAMSELDYSTYKKSIAILISSGSHKIYYLDIPVYEKVIVDNSFEIRDLVRNKKEQQKYLLLLLSAESARIYLGGPGKFVKIVSNVPTRADAYINDLPEKVGNFSDPLHRKEAMMNKFLMHMDAGLELLLQAYPLPLFVMGNDRIIGHFKKISRNLKCIVDYIHVDLIHAPIEKIEKVLEPFIASWKTIKEKHLLNRLDLALSEERLASGITDVWRQSMEKKGRLLVVEQNYMASAIRKDGLIIKPKEPSQQDGIIKDAVDDIIEKVLASGGDVEFVDDGILNNYGRIALVLYY